jgi:hypothetical protein
MFSRGALDDQGNDGVKSRFKTAGSQADTPTSCDVLPWSAKTLVADCMI